MTQTETHDDVSMATSLATMLAAATETDLQEVATQIANKQKELDALKQIYDLIALRLGVLPVKTRKKVGRPPASAAVPPLSADTTLAAKRKRIAVYLNNAGVRNAKAISTECGLPMVQLE